MHTFSMVAVSLLLAAGDPEPRSASVNAALVEMAQKAQSLLASQQLVGMVVGVTDHGKHLVKGLGTTALGPDGVTPDGRTVFEIGSITKVFTAVALAEMVHGDQVQLADPIRKFLNVESVPNWKGQEITLESLAVHRSGLPRIPSAILVRAFFDTNPYAKFDGDDLLAFLSSYRLKREVGAEYEYSNLGAGLLGYLLAERNQTDYETLIRKKVCEPLGLEDTTITLRADQKSRLALPYYVGGKEAQHWDFDALAGAGALRSTADDMLRFLDANLGWVQTPLTPALQICQEKRTETGIDGLSMGLGWHILAMDDLPYSVVWHNGGTGGYRSFVGFMKELKLGVVVLANTDHDVDSIALEVLRTLSVVENRQAEPAGFHRK